MMNFLQEKTGHVYPFHQYSQVVVQDYPFPGLVGQHTTSIMSDNYIDDFGVHKDFQYLWDGVAMQALSNQWFGNLLMPEKWNDIWLNNAFAQYFAGDVNHVFQIVSLINLLKEEKAKEIYPMLKDKFKNDELVLAAIDNFENQFIERLK